MTSTLIDSNVLIDIFDADTVWFEWSNRRLHEARLEGALIVNAVIASEVAMSFSQDAAFEKAIPPSMFFREDLPWGAGFASSRASLVYRKRGGKRDRTLPDFLIGAHALLGGHRLLTRDAARYRSYFPTLNIIAPDTHP